MNILLVLEIWRSKSKILSDENAARIYFNIISHAGYRLVSDYIDIRQFENTQYTEVLKCVVCYKICVFQIVFWYSNIICGSCYVRHFKLINIQQLNLYYTKCPWCMELIKLSNAIIIFQEIIKQPNFNLSTLYNNALINCDHNGCNHIVRLLNWYRHIKFNCDYRIVNCLSIKCSVEGNFNDIIIYFLRCYFYNVWCAG